MNNYLILKSFKGSQTGATTEQFQEGTERMLSDDLADASKGFILPVVVDMQSIVEVKEEKPDTKKGTITLNKKKPKKA